MSLLFTSQDDGTHDGEQSRGEAGNQVLPGPSTDDGVVSPRDGWPVISRHHQAHLNELAGVLGQPEGGRKGVKGRGQESWNKGKRLNRRYADKATVLLSPVSLNKSLKLKEGSNLPIQA